MTQNIGHIYLIDDDESMRTSLTSILATKGYIVEDYSSARAFLENSIRASPSVILLDMQMPDITGLDLQKRLLQLGCKTPIVFISGQSHSHQIVKSLKSGAMDFLFKPFNLDELLKAVSDAIDFDRRQLKRVSQNIDIKNNYSNLSPREKEVCFWLAKGLINKDISVKLGITDATIKVHKARVLNKMHVDSTQVLVRVLLQANLVDLTSDLPP